MKSRTIDKTNKLTFNQQFDCFVQGCIAYRAGT